MNIDSENYIICSNASSDLIINNVEQRQNLMQDEHHEHNQNEVEIQPFSSNRFEDSHMVEKVNHLEKINHNIDYANSEKSIKKIPVRRSIQLEMLDINPDNYSLNLSDIELDSESQINNKIENKYSNLQSIVYKKKANKK